MNKEYSDAFGFKLLGRFTSFLTEYPAVGSEIQKICDEDFKATCMKCYPIIVSTGVDPTTYTPKTVGDTKSIKEQLRDMFPISNSLKNPINIDESTSSCDEEETECVVVKSPTKIPTVVAKKIESVLKCSECASKDKSITKLESMLGKKISEANELCRNFDSVGKTNQEYFEKIQGLRKELESQKIISANYRKKYEDEKKTSEHRLQIWQNLLKDPEYQTFLEYRKFESFKRKRV